MNFTFVGPKMKAAAYEASCAFAGCALRLRYLKDCNVPANDEEYDHLSRCLMGLYYIRKECDNYSSIIPTDRRTTVSDVLVNRNIPKDILRFDYGILVSAVKNVDRYCNDVLRHVRDNGYDILRQHTLKLGHRPTYWADYESQCSQYDAKVEMLTTEIDQLRQLTKRINGIHERLIFLTHRYNNKMRVA